MKQIPLRLQPDPAPSFESFLPGDNAAALHHLRHLALGEAPVYLWGPAGCGKTHLLKALAARVQASGGAVQWFGPRRELPWTLTEACRLIVLDECDGLDEAQQHAAFALFVNAATVQTQIASAGRLPPIDLPLREDLRTRLGWGPVFGLRPLSDADSLAALKREFARRGLALPDGVTGFLLTRYARDLKSLTAVLDRLDEFALAEQRALTVPLLKAMLSDESPVT